MRFFVKLYSFVIKIFEKINLFTDTLEFYIYPGNIAS